MSLKIMPVLVVNLGCEMVYILYQRLQAQDVDNTKAARVINDVISNMFSFNFVDELMKGQPVYSMLSVKQVFETLVHSSIMRLSEQSFGKLFELMVMGLKYQVLACSEDSELFNVCMRHLRGVNEVIGQFQKDQIDVCKSLVTNVGVKLSSTYGSLPPGEWHQIRIGMLEFLKGKKVKISIFLHEGIQSNTGDLYLPFPQNPSIGVIKFSNDNGGEQQTVQLQCQLNLNKSDYLCHPEQIGANLYAKDRAAVQPPEGRKITNSVTNEQKYSPNNLKDQDQKYSMEEKQIRQEVLAQDLISAGLSDGGKVELNMLASMIRPRDQQDSTTKLKLNIFNDAQDDLDLQLEHRFQSSSQEEEKEVQEQKNSKSQKNVQLNSNAWKQQQLGKLVGSLDLDQGQACTQACDDNDDLLDLMDSVI